MRNKTESKKGQSGQILLYTTIILMLAAIILVPLMQFTYSSHRSATIRTQRTLELYASDAGIEDALYQIKTEQKGTALASLGFGNASYNPGTPAMNDRTENVTVQKVWLPDSLPTSALIPNKPTSPAKNWTNPDPVNDNQNPANDTDKSDKLVVVGMLQTVQATAAADDFDHGWPGGSSGGNWTGNWTSTGNVSIASGGASGNCTKFTASGGNATRQTSIPMYMQPELKFQARAVSFGASDSAHCSVSTDGGNWTTVATWVDGNETSSYNSFDVDLYDQYSIGGGDTTTPLWVRFDAKLSSSVIASDNFESNTWTGGSGWASQWTNSSGSGNPNGNTAITNSGSPHGGTYHLRLQGLSSPSSSRGYAQRNVNLSSYATPHLQFWAKAPTFSSSDNAQLLVKVGTGSFTTVATWTHNGSGNYTDDNTYHFFDLDLSQFGGGGQSSVWIAFKSNMSQTSEYFYVDDINIVQGASFNVDNVWIGYQANSNDVEIAYTDPHFAGGNGTNDPAYLDRIGVWMPPGCEYVGVVGNQTTSSLNQYLPQQPDILLATYAGGTILEWDFSSTVNLGQPWGNTTSLPIIWDLTFSYSMPPTQVMQGMFVWIKAHGSGSQTYLSWDQGYEIYKAVSKAHSQILGTNTQVAAYAGQGEINKNGAASYGDYVAAGAALLFDNSTPPDGIKRKAVNPSDPYTWVTYPSSGGFLYDGRDEITTIPSDATVTAAWLYWSAFMKTTDWQGFGSQPDTTVSFMYPMRYGPESFAASSGNLTYTVSSYAQSAQEPMDLLAHQPVLTLSNMRYLGEVLGTATAHNGNDTFVTAHMPIPSPAPNVKVGNQTLSQSGNYTIDYNTGKVTIINDNLSGQVKIDYSVSGTMTLGNSTDYTIIYDTLGQDTRYKGFTITNTQITQGKLQGTVTIDYYYAKHWVTVQHAAYDKYGTALPPAQTVVPLTNPVGDTYACFDDVTQLLTGNGTYTGLTGDGQYAVGNVTATVGGSDPNSDTRCFSGWSIIVLYESPTGQAHQFYLWDPIHNAAICPFMVQPNTDSSIQPPCISVPPYVEAPFTLNDFYPPEGTVSGKVTYFVGEGDVVYSGDSIGFKGASQTSYTFLSGPNNPVDNVMNCLSTNGQSGIDIDTYNILSEVGNDTTANVLLETQGDRWYLNYIILSFKTNVVPPPDYSFNVASITYQYQLGGK